MIFRSVLYCSLYTCTVHDTMTLKFVSYHTVACWPKFLEHMNLNSVKDVHTLIVLSVCIILYKCNSLFSSIKNKYSLYCTVCTVGMLHDLKCHIT